jgi:hypothetical protein
MSPIKSKKTKPSKSKKGARGKVARKKKRIAKKAPLKKASSKGNPAAKIVRLRGRGREEETVAFEPLGPGARSGGQSGDLQGLSDAPEADSESVDELLEEGNSFEAEVVKGMEDVPDADSGEVKTHEVPLFDSEDEPTEN